MNKFVKWILIIIGALILLGVVGFNVMKWQTKKHSPQETVTGQYGDADVEITYCRPFKKERVIFGDLVPYNKVWRTGANEATTFVNSAPINFGGETVPAGTYTLWTIPGKVEWEVILNEGEYGWGVNFSAEASREPEKDVASAKVFVEPLMTPKEQFTIKLNSGMDMTLSWDDTRVSVPIKPA